MEGVWTRIEGLRGEKPLRDYPLGVRYMARYSAICSTRSNWGDTYSHVVVEGTVSKSGDRRGAFN